MRLFSLMILMVIICSTAFASDIQTKLYLNEKVYNQFFMQTKKVKIVAVEWKEWLKYSTKEDEHNRPIINFSKNWTVRLNIKNNSDKEFNPIIKINYGQNWGDDKESIKNLIQPLKPNETVDFKINLNDYEFVGVNNTLIYLNISIASDENFSMNENYYSIWFELE